MQIKHFLYNRPLKIYLGEIETNRIFGLVVENGDHEKMYFKCQVNDHDNHFDVPHIEYTSMIEDFDFSNEIELDFSTNLRVYKLLAKFGTEKSEIGFVIEDEKNSLAFFCGAFPYSMHIITKKNDLPIYIANIPGESIEFELM